MQVETLFKRLTAEWPAKIDISDGYSVGEIGYMFPNLSGLWDVAEEKWTTLNDEWMELGSWCFFQTAHKAAKEQHKNGKKYLSLDNLSIRDFESYLRQNLDEPEWGSLRNVLK